MGYHEFMANSNKHIIVIKDYLCKECLLEEKEFFCKNRKVLGFHVKTHDLTTKTYIDKHYFPDGPPLCGCGCGLPTTWHKSNYSYNEFVTGHNRNGFKKEKSEEEPRVKRTYHYKNEGEFECKECGKMFNNINSLTKHSAIKHCLKSEDYAIKWFYDGKRPLCKVEDCTKITRYNHDFSFKKFCKDHGIIAMQDGGKIGGLAPSILKGLTKETNEQLARMSEALKGEGNPFYGKTHNLESKTKISNSKRLSHSEVLNRIRLRNEDWILVTEVTDYEKRQGQYLTFECTNCGYQTLITLRMFELGTPCKYCNKGKGISIGQNEVAKFVEKITSYPPEISTRRIISPLELDIYVEQYNLAIEYHGLYYHSCDVNEPDSKIRMNKRNHMLEKFNQCKAKNIKLLQIFSNEWKEKRPICESMIKHALNLSNINIDARKCFVQKLDKVIAKEFFENNHINGSTRSRENFALMYNNEIVSVISLRKPQGDSGGTLEIARFASKLNHNVRGGLGKLMNEVIQYAKTNNYNKILTYADLRFGTGNAYQKVGFIYIKHSGIGKEWTDGIQRFGRQTCKADPKRGLSEREVATERKLRVLNPPGNAVYELQL